MSIEAPRGNCCARFAGFISSGCLSFWNGLVDLIQRIRNCFCRSTPSEQPAPPPPLTPNRVQDLTSVKPPSLPTLKPSTLVSTTSLPTPEPQTPNSSNTAEPISVPVTLQKVEPIAPISTPPSTQSAIDTLSSSSLPIAVPNPITEEIPAAEEEYTVAKIIIRQFCDFITKSSTGWKNEIRSQVEKWIPLRDNMNGKELQDTLQEQEQTIAKECQRQLPLRHLQLFNLSTGFITQQGLSLFNCLCSKDQLFMLKKLQELGLVETFRLFVPQMGDPIQEKVTAQIDKLKQDALEALARTEVGQNALRITQAQMEVELAKYWECKPAKHSKAWDQIIKSTLFKEMEILAAEESPLAKHAQFVQQIISKALCFEPLDTYLTSGQGETEFNGFSLKDQLWIIEHLAALSGDQNTMRIIPPTCIVLLVNRLPETIRKQLTQSVYASTKPDLFEGLSLKPTLTPQDIQKHIRPSFWRL